MAMWMVRAERNGVLYEDFREQNLVAIGWDEAGDFTTAPDIERMRTVFRETFADSTARSTDVAAAQVFRFITEVQIGDRVISYDTSRRIYGVGIIDSEAQFDSSRIRRNDRSWSNIREVRWIGEVSRDEISQKSKYSLNALLTVFLLRPFTEAEFDAILSGNVPVAVSALDNEANADEPIAETVDDIEQRSLEFIKDMIAAISPNGMEEFMAGLLRAMGYKTRVSPIGPDRGQDILATPDALGLEDPRIVVEVKHRKGAIGAPDIRSFLGGRHPNDRGLYVSTGGFTKDARYEADRASIPLRLMTLDDLVELLVDYYTELDVETRAMVPLKSIYWPL